MMKWKRWWNENSISNFRIHIPEFSLWENLKARKLLIPKRIYWKLLLHYLSKNFQIQIKQQSTSTFPSSHSNDDLSAENLSLNLMNHSIIVYSWREGFSTMHYSTDSIWVSSYSWSFTRNGWRNQQRQLHGINESSIEYVLYEPISQQ